MATGFIQSSNLDETFRALRNQDPAKMRDLRLPTNDEYRSIPSQNFAPTTSVSGAFNSSMNKFASAGGGGVVYGQPQFFSPVHTPINWQIPSKRLEEYQWARFFYMNEPKVASSIDFYSRYPMNDFENECKDRKVKKYFDKFKKRLDIGKWCRLMSHEIHLLGDCFPFLEISCENCGGSGHNGDEICEHEGGTVRRIVILNPDFVEVFTAPMNPEPVIALKPDEELINMVQRKIPGYEKLTPEIRALVSSGQPIRLDNRNVFHLKYGESGYSRFGVGMVRRLFPTLSYKTKLMVAQWIVAERLIVPIKIVKVGSDERPAGPADIAAVQEQLAQTANDPNLTIVTHHAFELDFYGACHSSDTEVLTENGWKKFADVSKNKDEKIATYNLNNSNIEFDIPEEYHEYDFNGEMVNIKGRFVDVCVTPNHNMLASEREWSAKENKYLHSDFHKTRADNVVENTRFIARSDWKGFIPESLPYKNIDKISNLDLDSFLSFSGYYLSEGGLKIENEKIWALHITQSYKSEYFNSIKDNIYKVSSKIQESPCSDGLSVCQFIINDSSFARSICDLLGQNSLTKKIPRWMMDLPKRELIILLNAMMEGDGSIRMSSNGKIRCKYTTVSKELADSVQEILLKLGYDPKVSFVPINKPNYHDVYVVYWNYSTKEKGYKTVKDRNIGRTQYNGKVWCFTVKNGYFITRRNGKVGIHGNSGKVLTLSNEFELINQEILDGMMINNSLLNGEGPNFSSAAVGIEAMIERLQTFRREMAQWIEEKIYLPEAKRQGFIDDNPEEDEEGQEPEEEYIYPKVKWNSMHLRDQQQFRTFVLQLYEKGLLSAQTVLEAFDFDPDMEIERKRYDAVQMMALGQGQGGAGGAGGAGGGMGGGFGGGGGGGMPPMGGEGGGGMPPMGGEAPIGAGGGGMGAGGGGGAPPPPMATEKMSITSSNESANPQQYGGKILKKKTRERLDSQRQKLYKPDDQDQQGMTGMRDPKGRIVFTKCERELVAALSQNVSNGLIKYPIQPQFPVKFGNIEYPIDFAIPHLKIGLEADGEAFHSSPKQVAHDKERDMKLAQAGWTILRFKDNEIEKNIGGVIRTVLKTIMQKESLIQQQQPPSNK